MILAFTAEEEEEEELPSLLLFVLRLWISMKYPNSEVLVLWLLSWMLLRFGWWLLVVVGMGRKRVFVFVFTLGLRLGLLRLGFNGWWPPWWEVTKGIIIIGQTPLLLVFSPKPITLEASLEPPSIASSPIHRHTHPHSYPFPLPILYSKFTTSTYHMKREKKTKPTPLLFPSPSTFCSQDELSSGLPRILCYKFQAFYRKIQNSDLGAVVVVWYTKWKRIVFFFSTVAFLTKSTQFCLEKRVLGLSYKPYHHPLKHSLEHE